MKYIYLIKNLETGDYKIGISKHPSKRIEQLSTGSSSEIKLLYFYQSEHAYKIEKTLHNRFGHLRKCGEWFNITLIEEINFINFCKDIEHNIIFMKNNNNPFI